MVGNGYLLRKVRRVGRKRVNDYAPSQEAARLHLFRLNAEHVPNIGLTRYTCRVTGNGQIFFVSRFNGMINRIYFASAAFSLCWWCLIYHLKCGKL